MNIRSGNAVLAGRDTRGWLMGHFAQGPLQSGDLELKWFTHPKGDSRPEWSPPSSARTLNVLIRGRFVLVCCSGPTLRTRSARPRSHSC